MTTQRAPRTWTRGDGITLRPATDEDLARADVQRALRDGIERGYDGELPPSPDDVEAYAIEAADGLVGVVALRRRVPASDAATVHELAVLIAQRGHAYGSRALFALERRLARDGVREFYARVPRSNGRGLYFMLRCGYAPVPPQADDGATWFRRAKTRARLARAAPLAPRASAPSGDGHRGGTPPSRQRR